MTNVTNLDDFRKSGLDKYLVRVKEIYQKAGLTEAEKQEALLLLTQAYESIAQLNEIETGLTIPEGVLTDEQMSALIDSHNESVTMARLKERKNAVDVMAGLIANQILERRDW